MPSRGSAVAVNEVVVLANFEMSLSWRDLLKRTYHEVMKDDAQGIASQLAYYFFLALFPALLCVLAIASFFPLQNFTDDVIRLLGPFAPREAIDVIRQEMVKIAEGNHGGLLTIGLLGAIWSSSSAMVSLIGAMNKTYDITEGRPWWKVRLIAVTLTIALAVLVVIAATLIIAGPELAEFVGRHLGLSAAFVWTWKVVQWPLAFGMVVAGIGMIYFFAPDAEQDWVWITPGSFIATTLWLIGSLGFRYYAVHFGNYEKTYGTVGGVILLLLWFYLSGLVIVIGSEMNAEIEHTSPWGKAPGEKVPGRKKKIGAAAARAWHEHGDSAEPSPMAPPPAFRPARVYHVEAAARPSRLGTLAAYIAAFAMWCARRRSTAR
jgi:membrane protein